MITFIPLEDPTYPSAATLEAEDRADDLLCRQIAYAGAVAKWRRLALATLPQPEPPLTWPCSGADYVDVVAWLESLEVQMPTMEEAYEHNP